MFIIIIIFSGFAAQRGLWPRHPRGLSITHNDAPQSVGLLWTSDQLVAETSTWQHTIHRQTSMPSVGFEPTIAAGERPETYALDRAGTRTSIQHIKSINGIWILGIGSLILTESKQQYSCTNFNNKCCTPYNFYMARQPLVCIGLLTLEISLRHNTLGSTPMEEWPHQHRDLYLTPPTIITERHPAPGVIRTRNPSKRAATDPRLRSLGHWYRHHL
jgi:hypothetical protein